MTNILLSALNDDVAYKNMYDELSKYAHVDFVKVDVYGLKGYDIFIGKSLTKEALTTADCLQVAFTYKTGVDDFPLLELKKRGIRLVNTHADSQYVAEYAFGLAISLVNRITEFDKKFRKGVWFDLENPYWESIFKLKIGLLGYGNIGKKLNNILVNNHIETYTIDRGKDYKDIKTCSSLIELIDTTDMLIMSLPSTSDTDLIINEKVIEKLTGKYLVNVGRGNSIDLLALYNALKAKKMKGAAIDTWNKKCFDPSAKFYPTDIPFIELDNAILSPHQATYLKDGTKLYTRDILDKVIVYLNDGVLSDEIDLDKQY